MKITENIREQIDKFENEQIFTIGELAFPAQNIHSVANVLNALQNEGYIYHLARRFYYKPRKSSITNNPIPINEGKVVNYFAKNAGGYLTGLDVFRQMGLTSQMSFVHTIATFEKRKPLTAGNCRMRFVKAYCIPTANNIGVLRILDAIHDVKTIPDCSPEKAVKILSSRISEFTKSNVYELAKCAKNYPPRVRAIVGALLAQLHYEEEAESLRKTINQLSKFNMGISCAALPCQEQFNIV